MQAGPDFRAGIGYFDTRADYMGLPDQIIDVEAAGRGTITQMLEESISIPALPTFKEPPGDTGARVGRVLQGTLRTFTSAARGYSASSAPERGTAPRQLNVAMDNASPPSCETSYGC